MTKSTAVADKETTAIQKLLEKNPDKKPGEIAKLYARKYNISDRSGPSVQKVSAVKRAMNKACPPPAKTLSPKKSTSPKSGKKSRAFKKVKTGEVYTVEAGKPLRHFSLPGSTTRYSLDDFEAMIKKNCSVVVEVDPSKKITEMPITELTAADFILGG